ncbi:MAG TPA: class E sortase [Burkholderiales bacterium]|nr:class E sortase [Burkholderiales bacterium]
MLSWVTLIFAYPSPTAAAATPMIGRIVIPAIRLDVLFTNGQAPTDTAFGPSHYPWTAMPGQGRTVAIAGHRVTHTHPFLRLNELRYGDLVEIRFGPAPTFPKEACYRVRHMHVVRPTNVGVTRDTGYDRLVLTTCHPPRTAIHRLVVTARRAACVA